MRLPLFAKKSSQQQFLSLVVSEGTVAAALWSVDGSGPKVVKGSHPVAWNIEAESSLVEASDVALEELGSQANTVKEVLLGLPESWAAHQSIAADKKHLLKKLADQLNLKSVGFVITQEAITALYRDRERTGFNALVVFVSAKNVHLFSVLHGKANESVSVGRSDSLTKDILEGCARGNFTALPARILLASQDLSGEEMKSLQSELGAYQWEEKLFVHSPRVDAVSPPEVLEAVSLAGGKEVARALGLLKEDGGEQSGLMNPSQPEKQENANDSFGFAPVAVDTKPSEEKEVKMEPDAPLDFGIDEPVRSKLPRKPILIALAVFILMMVFAGLVYASTKAASRVEIAAIVKTQPVGFDTTMTIDANAAQTDPENNILKASLRTKEVSDTSEALTTGSKIIGDKATGTVTIYNRTTVGDKLFKAGTVLKLDDKIQFTLDADTTVPVGTAANEYVGKISAKVTAANFGAESNIDQGVELSIGGFDKASFVAKTESKFTGGSSRSIQVVSDADQKKLADTLYAQLKTQALSAFNSEANPSEHIILSDKVTVSKKQFSDDIGKEVKSFTLTMTVSATAIVYTNEDISAFSSAKLASQIPAGSTLKSDRTVIEVTASKTISDTKTEVSAKISSIIIPAFDSEQIAGVLAGKTVEEANSFLQTQSAIGSYTLVFKPGFAEKLLGRLPNQSSRIHITSKIE